MVCGYGILLVIMIRATYTILHNMYSNIYLLQKLIFHRIVKSAIRFAVINEGVSYIIFLYAYNIIGNFYSKFNIKVFCVCIFLSCVHWVAIVYTHCVIVKHI